MVMPILPGVALKWRKCAKARLTMSSAPRVKPAGSGRRTAAVGSIG